MCAELSSGEVLTVGSFATFRFNNKKVISYTFTDRMSTTAKC